MDFQNYSVNDNLRTDSIADSEIAEDKLLQMMGFGKSSKGVKSGHGTTEIKDDDVIYSVNKSLRNSESLEFDK